MGISIGVQQVWQHKKNKSLNMINAIAKDSEGKKDDLVIHRVMETGSILYSKIDQFCLDHERIN